MAKSERNEGQEMDIKKVRELVKLVEESGIEELEISHADTTIRIQKSAAYLVGQPPIIPTQVAAVGPVPPAAATAGEPDVDPARGKWRDVRSPIVGTFYLAASPATPPFVKIGDHIQVGQPLCIVEAMKVMNEIEAEFAGTIKEILMADGSPVEAEGVLFLVDPD